MHAHAIKGYPLKKSLSSSMSLVNGLASREVTVFTVTLLVSPIFFQRFCIPFLFSHSPFLFITDDGILCALLCTLLFRGMALFSFLLSCLCGRNITAQWLFALQHSRAAQQLGGTMWLGLASGSEEGFVPLWAWSSKSLQLCCGAPELCIIGWGLYQRGSLNDYVEQRVPVHPGLPKPHTHIQHILHMQWWQGMNFWCVYFFLHHINHSWLMESFFLTAVKCMTLWMNPVQMIWYFVKEQKNI